MSSTLARAEVLTVRRNGRTLIDGVSAEIHGGQVLAVLGPNGAGKTTWLECLVGAARPDVGRVVVGERPLRSLADFAHTFAFMPDAAQLPPELYVGEIALRVGRRNPERTSALAQKLGVTPLGDARAGELSRGEARRVAILAALALDRPVTVLDEPFGVFDPLQLEGVLAIVREESARGRAIVASIHQLADAAKVADRVLLLSAGRTIASGTLDELRERAGAHDLEQVFVTLLRREREASDAPA